MRVSVLLGLAVLVSASTTAAAPIRILAASDLRTEATLSADGSVLGVEARLRDDRGRALRGQTVRLSVETDLALGHAAVLSAVTNESGIAHFDVPVVDGARSFSLQANFDGSAAVAGSPAPLLRVDLDHPAPVLVLEVPSSVGYDADFNASVTLQTPALESPGGLEVQLLGDGRPLAGPVAADATGHVGFRVRALELGTPGVHTLRAIHERQGFRVSSPDQRLIVRIRTAIALARAPGEDDDGSVVGGLSTQLGGIPREPVQIRWQDRVVAAALTDDQGRFVTAVDPDVLGRPGLVLRAYFVPSEPWYEPASSVALRLSPPEPRKISWMLVGSPLAFALAVLGLVRLRRRPKDAHRERRSLPPIDGAAVFRVAVSRAGTVRISLQLVDRATRAVIPTGTAEWVHPPLGSRDANEAAVVPGGGRFELRVSALGYAPRTLAGELPRGGEYAVQVPLRTWREELFDRARRWMRAAGTIHDGAPPTPREVLASRGATPESEALVSFVEQGSYGATPPDAETIAAADAMGVAADPPGRRER